MSIEHEIEEVLFDIGKNVQIHMIDGKNSVIEINYEKHVGDILNIIKKYYD